MEKAAKEFADIYDHLAKKWRSIINGGFNVDDLHIIFKDVMEAVEEANGEWTGEKKKRVANQLVDHFINDLKEHGTISEILAENLKLAASLLSTTVFTVAVAASKGNLNINNATNSCCDIL